MKTVVNGILLLNKEVGISSNKALQTVKHIFKAKKAGHTGTLDPLASGLLPICFGEATKFANFLLDSSKEYVATIKLGEATTTFDAEGEIVTQDMVTSTLTDILNTLKKFCGIIVQIPPIYSALKVKGKPLYEYARSNLEVEIKARSVNIYNIELIEFKAPDILIIKVLCSKGTYIRSLAHDIGQDLGCGAYLKGLIRTATNNYALNTELSIAYLKTLEHDLLLQLLLPVDDAIKHLPKYNLLGDEYGKIKNGQDISFSDQIAGYDNIPDNNIDSGSLISDVILVRLYFNDVFVGLGKLQNLRLYPYRLCNSLDFGN